MIYRLLAVLLPITASGVVAFFTFGISRWVAYLYRQLHGNLPLAPISQWFYPPSSWPYLFPLPFVLWAIVVAIKFRHSDRSVWLVGLVTLSFTVAFFSVFLFAIVLPFCPFPMVPMRPN